MAFVLSLQFFSFSRDLREAASDSEESGGSFLADSASGREEATSESGKNEIQGLGSRNSTIGLSSPGGRACCCSFEWIQFSVCMRPAEIIESNGRSSGDAAGLMFSALDL